MAVLGSPSRTVTVRGYLYGATWDFTCSMSSSSVASVPGASTTWAAISWPSSGCGTPTTAASATAGCS